MARVIVLGSGTPIPEPKRGGSAVAVVGDRDWVLVDCAGHCLDGFDDQCFYAQGPATSGPRSVIATQRFDGSTRVQPDLLHVDTET